ncbi:MAG: ComEC/Rec2 family competence protein [Chloroflexi bacterium]|nr:ComEC/Rec2 family competence protein [Chloroflexota bacterium]
MPLAWLGLGFSLGLFWGASAPLPPLGLALLLLTTGGGYLLARSASLPLGGAALLATGLLLGALRAGPDVLDGGGTLEALHNQRVELTGTVEGVAEPVGSIIRFTLAVERSAQADASGIAVVWANQSGPQLAGRSFPFLEHGDQVTVGGILAAPTQIGAFDYPEHLAAQGVTSVLSNGIVTDVVPATGADTMRWVHTTRASLARSVERHMPEPQAALTNALILGLRGGLTPELNEEFRKAGLSHLLAVSGMHVGILLAIALGASARVIGRHRRIYLLPPLLLLWLYVLMVGAPPSAVRAGLMGSVFLLALAFGRASVPVNALGLAAFAMLALHPAAMWDRSLQLSFSAMAGALLIGLPLASRAYSTDTSAARYAQAARQWIAAPAAISFGAVLGSLPLVAFNFGQVPLLSIPATLVAMPFVPPLLVTGLATALLGSLAAPLGAVAGLAPAALGAIVVGVAKVFASLPGATLGTQLTSAWVWTGYAAIASGIAIVLAKRWLPTARSVATAVWLGPKGDPCCPRDRGPRRCRGGALVDVGIERRRRAAARLFPGRWAG